MKIVVEIEFIITLFPQVHRIICVINISAIYRVLVRGKLHVSMSADRSRRERRANSHRLDAVQLNHEAYKPGGPT